MTAFTNSKTYFKHLSELIMCVPQGKGAEEDIASASTYPARGLGGSVCPPHVHSQANKVQQQITPRAGEITGHLAVFDFLS